MNAKAAKALRRALRELGIYPKQTGYDVVPLDVYPSGKWVAGEFYPVRTEMEVRIPFFGLIGYIVPVVHVTLHKGCGRAIYKEAKKRLAGHFHEAK